MLFPLMRCAYVCTQLLRRVLSPALFLWCLAALLSTNALSAEHGIENTTLRVEFDTASAVVTAWQVKCVAHGEPAIIRDLAAPARGLFRVGGTVNGRTLADWEREAGGWKAFQKSPMAMDFLLAPQGQAFSIRQSWTLDPTKPWFARYSIVIESADGAALDDALWMELGPGIGEVPTEGLGASEDIYSFTELIHDSADGVQRERFGVAGAAAKGALDGRWIGLQSRYFALIVSPENGHGQGYSWEASAPEKPQWYPQHPGFETNLRVHFPPLQGNSESHAWAVYGGGKSYQALREAQPDLSEVLFPGMWGWMRMLTIGMMHVLGAIHGVVGSWGLSIIVLAVFVRILVHPVARRAMAAQKRFVALQEKIQPELVEIKKNYKGGEQSERILQLYEKHKTSPFAGLKPLLIVLLQIPVFVALYHLLGQLFELRSEPFLWMKTLAEPDGLLSFGVMLPFFGSHFNLLPALMALVTIASIKLSPAPAVDAKASTHQNAMLVLMALVFFLLFYSFPSGMVLYWMMANMLHLAHGLAVSKKSAKNS